MPLSDDARGALCMTAAMGAFVLNDALMKGLADTLDVSALMVWRGLLALGLVLAFAAAGRSLPDRAALSDPMIWLRSLAEAIATVSFLAALAALPLADVTAILQVVPLVVAFLAARTLGEPLGLDRTLAILAGLAGVLLVVRPGGTAFGAATGWALVAVVFSVVRDLATRRMRAAVPSASVAVITTAFVALLAGTIWLSQPAPAVPAPGDWPRLAMAAALLVAGYQLSIVGLRTGALSAVAPFRYTGILWAILFGVLFFGQMPDAPTLAGATLIVVAGIWSLSGRRWPAAVRRP